MPGADAVTVVGALLPICTLTVAVEPAGTKAVKKTWSVSQACGEVSVWPCEAVLQVVPAASQAVPGFRRYQVVMWFWVGRDWPLYCAM